MSYAQKFQPSVYTAHSHRKAARETPYAGPPVVRTNYGSPLDAVAEITTSLTALTGEITGGIIQSVQAGQEAKMSDACGTSAKFKAKYDACKKANQAKGKPVYPNNPGKLPFPSDCRDDYNKWQKYKAYCGSAGGMTDVPMTVEEESGGGLGLLLLLGGVVALGAGAYFMLNADATGEESATGSAPTA